MKKLNMYDCTSLNSYEQLCHFIYSRYWWYCRIGIHRQISSVFTVKLCYRRYRYTLNCYIDTLWTYDIIGLKYYFLLWLQIYLDVILEKELVIQYISCYILYTMPMRLCRMNYTELPKQTRMVNYYQYYHLHSFQ